jgi:hypothetical protein
MAALVLERLPKRFIPYKNLPEYQLTYYIEKLACGHEHTHYPQSGPMAKRRHCGACAKLSGVTTSKPKRPIPIERHAQLQLELARCIPDYDPNEDVDQVIMRSAHLDRLLIRAMSQQRPREKVAL